MYTVSDRISKTVLDVVEDESSDIAHKGNNAGDNHHLLHGGCPHNAVRDEQLHQDLADRNYPAVAGDPASTKKPTKQSLVGGVGRSERPVHHAEHGFTDIGDVDETFTEALSEEMRHEVSRRRA